MINQTKHQFVFVRPGEKVYVLVRGVAGSDYTHVVEVTFPVIDHDGVLFVDPRKAPECKDHDLLEENECCNLTCDGKTLVEGYAEKHSKGLRSRTHI